MGQGDSAGDFDPSESVENAGILDVFPIFHTARLGQKIRRSPQFPLCGVALICFQIGSLGNFQFDGQTQGALLYGISPVCVLWEHEHPIRLNVRSVLRRCVTNKGFIKNTPPNGVVGLMMIFLLKTSILTNESF